MFLSLGCYDDVYDLPICFDLCLVFSHILSLGFRPSEEMKNALGLPAQEYCMLSKKEFI